MQANALFQNRPPLWLYYENPYYQWRRPEYLNLCLETVQRHCGRRFRVRSTADVRGPNWSPWPRRASNCDAFGR